MRPNHSFFALALALASVACSNGTGTSSTKGAGGSGTTGATTAAAGMPTGAATTGATGATTSTSSGSSGGIPDPGTSNQVDIDFKNTEPNDTPQTATPLGVAKNAGVAVWVTNNTIGGTDTTDYFVFRMGPTPGPFNFSVCFGTSLTGMTATLWKVVNGVQQMPPVGTWTAPTTCVSDMGSAPTLEANAVYLFGLTASGGQGSYGA